MKKQCSRIPNHKVMAVIVEGECIKHNWIRTDLLILRLMQHKVIKNDSEAPQYFEDVTPQFCHTCMFYKGDYPEWIQRNSVRN